MDLQKIWYQKHYVFWPLIPLSVLYSWGIQFRKFLYKIGVLTQVTLPVPIIVVGNITVGGTGKTPLVIYIANLLKSQGFKPGIVSRGYKGSHLVPTIVSSNSDPMIVGDESVIIAKQTNCPMMVGKDRSYAAKKLLETFPVNVIVSDDGLQHYALGRQIEIAVIDGKRQFGNEYCLPAGPLREPKKRLDHVNLIVVNSENNKNKDNEFSMKYEPGFTYKALNPNHEQRIEEWKGKKVHAVAGLGNPNNFFDLLKKYGIDIIPHAFPDHYQFKEKDLEFKDKLPVIMTEKDAIKCKGFFTDNHWVLPISAVLNPLFDAKLLNLFKGVLYGQEIV